MEWGIAAGSIAGFLLLFALFAKVFPIISIWEIAEGEEALEAEVDQLKSFLPNASAEATGAPAGQRIERGPPAHLVANCLLHDSAIAGASSSAPRGRS